MRPYSSKVESKLVTLYLQVKKLDQPILKSGCELNLVCQPGAALVSGQV